MAAYATTTVLALRVVKKILDSPQIGLMFGTVAITNYNSVGVEIAAITRNFRSIAYVVCSGVSDGAVKQLVRWDAASKAFKCYVPTTGAETANDVNVGSVHFMAYGTI